MHMVAAGVGVLAAMSSQGVGGQSDDVQHAAAAQADYPDGTRLVLELERAAVARAKDIGLTLAFTTCTNRVTAFLCESELGFRRAVTASPRAFQLNGETPLALVPEIHDDCSVFERTL